MSWYAEKSAGRNVTLKDVEAAEAAAARESRVAPLGMRAADLSMLAFDLRQEWMKATCPMCGQPSQRIDGAVVLCHACAMDKEHRADERAVYGGPAL